MEPQPLGENRRVLIRDLLIFQLKLVLDGLKDMVLIQASIAAAVLGVVLGRPGLFYRVLRLSERFDLWLNLYSAADGATETDDGLFGASRAGSDSLLGKLEQIVRNRVEEPRPRAA